MIANHIKRTLPTAAITVTLAMLVPLASRARAATAPVKLVPSSHITGGFEYLESVAVAPDGNIYVADRGRSRVQELTATGEFVLMFGREVNETTNGDICTAEEVGKSGVKCKAGVAGTAAGEFNGPESVSVDPVTHNVYVQELFNWRVQEFTATGEFVAMVGKEVNDTKDKSPGATEAEKNVCTAASGDVCKAGVRGAGQSAEHGGFDFAQFHGELLAVGGPDDLLYVGDEHRVQEFDAAGVWKGEISLTAISAESESHVTALTIDEAGDLFLIYEDNRGGTGGNIIRKFDPSGVQVAEIPVSPSTIAIQAMALDAAGHLAVTGSGPVGLLVNATTGHPITEFTIPGALTPDSIAFDASGELYAVTGNELTVYTPENVAELVGSPVTCSPGVDDETSATFDCALKGEVNPEGVSETEVFFEWGPTEAFGETTGKQKVEEPKAVSATITGLRPNETFYDQLIGSDHNAPAPERLTSERVSFTTPVVPPRIVGEASVAFVTASSAALFGELNPENTNTEYFFEYGACEELAVCASVLKTSALQSSAYGVLSLALEADELQPVTAYHYRLVAINAHKEAVHGAEGAFTSGLAPNPAASTQAVSNVTATGATLHGAVDPDGAGATYAFQVGVYNGAGTVFSTIVQGPTGPATESVPESFALTGLQPGTTYAYRIAISSAYGASLGEPVLFSTAGLPTVLFAPIPPGLLAVPNIAFPSVTAVGNPTTTRGLTSAQKLAKALRACKAHRVTRKQRVACEKQARKRYATKSKQADNRKRG